LAFSAQAYAENSTNAAHCQTGLVDKSGNVTVKGDHAITDSIKHYIRNSKTLSKLPVEVSTKEGVVTLKGTVNADSEASTLIEVSESVGGVKEVNSELKVKEGTQLVADTIITAKIKGLLIREKLFGEKDIASINTQVETKDGIVYLTGVVDNKDQINNAIEIIKQNIPEVKKVEYNVKKSINATE
jgi:osmotically-inducible protein OsmY